MGGCSKCCKDEFKLCNIGLVCSDPDRLVRCQWNVPCIHYAIYRIVVALYFSACLIANHVEMIAGPSMQGSTKLSGAAEREARWVIFLSNWQFVLLTLSTMYQAISVCICTYKRQGMTCDQTLYKPMPIHLRLQWIIYNAATNISMMVSVIYWSAVYRGGPISWININNHIISSMYSLLDLLINGTPIRLNHVLHSLIPGLIYIIFSVIYVAAGGDVVRDDPFVYILDWYGNTGISAGLSLAIEFIGLPLLWSLIYAIYQFRLFISARCTKRTVEVGNPMGNAVTSKPTEEEDKSVDNASFEKA